MRERQNYEAKFRTLFHSPYSRDAFYSGSQEKLVYLPCIIGGTLTDSDVTSNLVENSEDKTRPDYLATVDTDPASPTYSQVKISILELSELITRDLVIARLGEKCK